MDLGTKRSLVSLDRTVGGGVKEQRHQTMRWRDEQEVRKQQILIVNGGEQEVNTYHGYPLRVGILLSTLCMNTFRLHQHFEVGTFISMLQMRKLGLERFGNLPEVTQQVRGGAGIPTHTPNH